MEFKNGQKVKHPIHGEGVIKFHQKQSLYYVVFNEVETKLRRFGDHFYNQLQSVKELPEVGEYAYFWNDVEKLFCIYGKYIGKSINNKYQYKVAGTIMLFSNISKTPPFK